MNKLRELLYLLIELSPRIVCAQRKEGGGLAIKQPSYYLFKQTTAGRVTTMWQIFGGSYYLVIGRVEGTVAKS